MDYKRINKHGILRFSFVCRKCYNARTRKYRSSPQGKANCLKAIKKWESKNKTRISKIKSAYAIKRMRQSYTAKDKTEYNKYRARWLFQYRVNCGDIKRGTCAVCNNIKTDAHHDNYDKPFHICWLCKVCHLKLHNGLVKVDDSLYNTYIF